MSVTSLNDLTGPNEVGNHGIIAYSVHPYGVFDLLILALFALVVWHIVGVIVPETLNLLNASTCLLDNKNLTHGWVPETCALVRSHSHLRQRDRQYL